MMFWMVSKADLTGSVLGRLLARLGMVPLRHSQAGEGKIKADFGKSKLDHYPGAVRMNRSARSQSSG